MLRYVDSDIYNFYNRGNGITKRIQNSLASIRDDTIINSKLDKVFTGLLRSMKESVTAAVIHAARENEILLLNYNLDSQSTADPRFPETVPFVKAKWKGAPRAFIDVSRITRENDAGELEIDRPKLYTLMVAADVSLKLCGESDTLPYEANRQMAILFSRMFCQTLTRMGMLPVNSDRYEAFMYFTSRFFLTYYAQCPYTVVDSISTSFIDGHKNDLILFMEDKIRDKNLDPYSSFTAFSQTLYDNEISGIRTTVSRLNDINQSSFLSKFINMYSKNAIAALWSIDYFFYILLGANKKTNVVFDRAFDDIFRDAPRAMPKLLMSLYKELT